MLKQFKADLHIHSTLSPCGSLEMSPKAIVKKAHELELTLITISDHNQVENCKYLEELASEYNIKVLFGMEAQTIEEFHTLVLFDNYKNAYNMWLEFYNFLPDIENNPDLFGDQVVVDKNENIEKFEKKLLLNSANIDFDTLINMVKKNNGICIPAHVDAESYSIISQLGFVPDNPEIFALEVCHPEKLDEFLTYYPELKKYRFVTFSDAHYLKDMGKKYSILLMEEPTIEGLKKTLKNKDYIKLCYETIKN